MEVVEIEEIEMAPPPPAKEEPAAGGEEPPEPEEEPGGGEEPQMAVDLLGRGVGDAPVVLAIAPRAAVALRQVGGDRAGGADHLIPE